jgi:hypothetical protein
VTTYVELKAGLLSAIQSVNPKMDVLLKNLLKDEYWHVRMRGAEMLAKISEHGEKC